MSHIEAEFVDKHIASLINVIDNLPNKYLEADLYYNLLNTFIKLQNETGRIQTHAKYADKKQKQ